jgi:DNA (cytosine-5)-methyltransferase 1
MGWQAAGFSEIEKFPSEVLAHHYPTVTNFGDMTQYKEWNLGSIDLLVGGTPCQSFSVAGLRKGMDDPRGNLALVYCGILNHYRPKWFVWENVPGVLSSNRGRDFGAFLGALAELGYGFAYRVLDAQYWGVAQRRKRVFVVGYLGDWRPAGAVLFEPKSVSRDTAPSRKEGQGVAGGFVPSIASTIQTTCHDYSRADGFNMIATGAFGKEIADTVTAKFSKGAELLQQGAQNGGNCVLQPIHCVETFPTLLSSTAGVSRPGNAVTEHQTYVAFGWQNSTSQSMSVDAITPTLDKSKTPATLQNMAVRRLTPVECERLQGFPDDYTNIKDKCPDGPRYKAMGNSMAVPVMRWIGERINKVNNLL